MALGLRCNLPGDSSPTDLREDADVESSSDQYAQRFAGPVGAWFLDVQARRTLEALRGLTPGATVLDVGGGHAQLTPALVQAGYDVTVVGSDERCQARLQPWTSTARCRFEVADLRALPYPDRAFDAVLCYRLLAHSVDWRHLVGELCRVARRRVAVDYPSSRSLNLISDQLFLLKKRIEVSTRRYLMFSPREIRTAFAAAGFRVAAESPQFLLPMVLHRATGSVAIARATEGPARALGLTRLFGSPVIVRADRVD